MALIKCSECGKEFSDKAPACPNCGCPTEHIQDEEKEETENIIIEQDGFVPEEESHSVSAKLLNSFQKGVQTITENRRDAYRSTKHVGPVQIDENHRVFRINGKVMKNGKKNGIGKSMVKGLAAVSTVGLSVLMDGSKQKVGNKEWFNFDELLNYDLMEDDSIVTSGGVGQALVGGLLFGDAGGIAGGITGKRVQKKRVESIVIKVTLNSFDAPCILIPIITKPTKINTKEYQNAFKSAHEILSILDVITHNK